MSLCENPYHCRSLYQRYYIVQQLRSRNAIGMDETRGDRVSVSSVKRKRNPSTENSAKGFLSFLRFVPKYMPELPRKYEASIRQWFSKVPKDRTFFIGDNRVTRLPKENTRVE